MTRPAVPVSHRQHTEAPARAGHVRGTLVRLLRALVLGVMALATPAAAWAQAVGGAQITGIVRDSSGGALPGVDVTVTRTDTGVSRSAVSSGDGAFAFPNLPVGPYQLKATLQGFSTFVQDGIVLQVNSNPSLNVTLQIGAVSEQLTVTANASMVETRSTGIGQVIDNKNVVELPLNGRQATELIFLSGLATSAPAADLNTNKNFPTVTISVAGGQANGMTYIMDGGTHNDPFNNLNLPTPFPDALQEFKVETSALPARYGHHASSAVNLVTRSGTNNFKGTVFDFLRNYRFNARNALATTRDSLERNQFGGSLGGPLVKNKAFFFGGFQGRIEKSNPPTAIRWVPTAQMLAGDFSAFASPACNGGRQVTLRAPFVDNRVPAAALNPVALAFSKYLPSTTDPCGRVQFGIPNDSTEQQAIGRIDYTLSTEHTVFARYMFARYNNPATYDGQNVLTLSRTGQENIAHSTVVGHKWLPTNTLVNSFTTTFNRTLNDRPLPEFFTATSLGSRIASPYPGYMGISVTGNGFTVGAGGTNPGYFNSVGFQLADDLDLIRGDHQISAGVNWIHTNIKTNNNRPTNGQFTFNGQTTGLSLADFMVGSVSGGFVQGNPVFDDDDHDYIGVYLQDDWRVKPNISLNVGVRWEPYIPLRNSRSWVSHFDKTRFDQGLVSKVYPQAPAGLIFPGDDGYQGRGANNRKLAMFAPRVGAIWTPEGDSTMSVRASWGIFYDTPHLFFNTRFSNNPPWGAQITIANPAGGFTDPYQGYPGGNPFPALNDNWQTSAFPAFGVYVNSPLDINPQRLQQWNLSVQKGFGDWLMSVSYLGNRMSNLWRATELNPAVYSPTATTGNTNQRRVLYLQDPAKGQFFGTIGQVDDTGRSNYHGLLLSAQKRLSHNFSVLSNWTISKCMSDPATSEITGPTIVNPNDPDLDYAYCGSDRRHVVNLSAVVRAPEFSNDLLRAILGNWQVSPIVRWQSGNRSTVTTGVDNALTGMGGQRAVQVLDDPYGDKTAGNYLNRAAFTSPTAGTYSPLKPFTVVNPSNFQNDIAISRSFRFGSRSLQARWEIFNVINYVNLGAPITSLNSAAFGQIQTAGDPRIMQFALKFDF